MGGGIAQRRRHNRTKSRAVVHGAVSLLLAAGVGCGSRTALGPFSDRPTDGGDGAVESSDADADAPDAPTRDAACVGGLVALTQDGVLERVDPATLALTPVASVSCTFDWYDLDRRPADGALVASGHGTYRIDSAGSCAPFAPPGLQSVGGGVITLAFVGDKSTAKMWLIPFSGADGSHGLWREEGGSFALVPGFDPKIGRCKLTGTEDGRLFGLCAADEDYALIELAAKSPTSIVGPITRLPGPILYWITWAMAVEGGRAWVFTTTANDSARTAVRRVDLGTREITELGTISGRIAGATWLPQCQ